METDLAEIKLRGKAIKVPSTCINNKTVVVTGKWVRMAAVYDEDWLEGQVVDDPEVFIKKLKERNLRADIFTFAQKIPNTKPMFKYHMEWDNVAAIPITSFKDWWKQVSTDMRKDLKRADKRGVVVKTVEFNDELVKGLIGIHNDSPIRQGVPFAYYRMEFDDLKKGYGTYLDRSEFVGAYHRDELIGIIKIVYVGELACLMEIFTKSSHYDKRPTNALIAKAVEICEKKGKSYLTYGQYYYGNKRKSSLVDFKHRNGFERILFPRYYIPLTFRGKIIIKLKLHLGLHGILPGNLIFFLVNVRSKFYQRILPRSESAVKVEMPRQGEKLGDDQG